MGFQGEIGKRQINKNTNSSTFFSEYICYCFHRFPNAHSKEFLIISQPPFFNFFSFILFCLCDNGRSLCVSIDMMKIKKEWKFKKHIKKFCSPYFLHILPSCLETCVLFCIFLGNWFCKEGACRLCGLADRLWLKFDVFEVL